MILNYVSDLHLESGKLNLAPPDIADVVVIAGDLWNGNAGLLWLEEQAQRIKQPIVYVPGNHCFWDNDLYAWPDKAKKFCDEVGVHFLYNDSVTIKDTVFLGTTLWTNFNALGNDVIKKLLAPEVMSDYVRVKSSKSQTDLIRPEEIHSEHRHARAWLDSMLTQHKDDKTCVVTHHCPSKRSIHPDFRDSKYVPYYASDLDDFILAHQPDVWVHGHVHQTQHYFIDDTLVVCNARGHDDKPPPYWNKDFNVSLVLDF